MKIFNLIVVVLIASACSTQQKESLSSATPNSLTEEQKKEGWRLLFDGTTMNGWRSFKNLPNNTWEVQDGMLHCKSPEDTTADQRADLMTEEQFDNFEFAFDWKIGPTFNSGVMFRVTEEYDVPYATGPEFQVIDDIGYATPLKPENTSGGTFDMYVPEGKVLNPAGQWNSGKILVDGPHVEHWVNGTKVLEYELWSEEWKSRVANTKWKDFPGYGLAKKGHIDLQEHGGEVWFRNLIIRPI